MNKDWEWIGCGVSAAFTLIQTQEVFQLISLILTCIATLVAIAFTLYKWYKHAKADGKIDIDEIEQAVDIVKDGIDKIKDNIESSKEEEGDKK